jgi:hypothetical protein
MKKAAHTFSRPARALGKKQLERLMGLASPSSLLVVGDDVSASLVKRGLLKPHFEDKPDAWHRITPSGIRALADAYEAGQLEPMMKPFPPKHAPDLASKAQSVREFLKTEVGGND